MTLPKRFDLAKAKDCLDNDVFNGASVRVLLKALPVVSLTKSILDGPETAVETGLVLIWPEPDVSGKSLLNCCVLGGEVIGGEVILLVSTLCFALLYFFCYMRLVSSFEWQL